MDGRRRKVRQVRDGGSSVSSPSPTHRRAAARERAAAVRAEQARAEQRRRLLLAGAAVVVVVAVIVGLVVVKLVTGGSGTSGTGSASSTAASSAVVSAVTNVPAAAYAAVGAGTVKAVPAAVTNGQPLTADGKPRVVYIGAEYCPYCAAERWAVVAALARFGTWSNLGQTKSASNDVFPDTATLSFHGATYRSNLLGFTGVEQTDRNRHPLDALSAADQQIFQAGDPGGGIPFVDLAGRYTISGASYDPSVLSGKTAQQIGTALSDPSSAISKAVLGTANVITAALCQATNSQPSAVCTSSGVTKAAGLLSGGQP
jgi:hypothetical protein